MSLSRSWSCDRTVKPHGQNELTAVPSRAFRARAFRFTKPQQLSHGQCLQPRFSDIKLKTHALRQILLIFFSFLSTKKFQRAAQSVGTRTASHRPRTPGLTGDERILSSARMKCDNRLRVGRGKRSVLETREFVTFSISTRRITLFTIDFLLRGSSYITIHSVPAESHSLITTVESRREDQWGK